MALELHHTYTVDEAIAGLANKRPVDAYCDGQFLVTPETILCFFILGEPPYPSKLSTPSSLEWRPIRLDYHPAEDLPWFPLAVRETHPGIGHITSRMNASEWLRIENSRPKEKRLSPKKHHVFLKAPADDKYLYAGPSHLAGYSMSSKDADARFDFPARLPREMWVRFGGYKGWLIEVDHTETEVGVGDLILFESLLNRFKAERHSHFELTRYEEDTLHVYTNPRCAWLMYLRNPGDSGLYIHNLDETSEKLERFFCTCGIDLEFPADHTLPKEEAIHVAKEFFRTGRLSADHVWTEEA